MIVELISYFCLFILAQSIPPYPARWQREGVTVAGGHGPGDGTHQLQYHYGLFVDDDQTVYISDWLNHRIVAWKTGATTGEIVAGGNGQGNQLDQLNGPTNVIIDRETNSLLICDRENRRVVRWPCPSHLNNTNSKPQGEIVIDNITCWGLTMDNQGSLYGSDCKKNEVRRYDKGGDKKGIVVAGGHGQGAGLHQLKWPTYLFVDAQSTLYISDTNNHRVMKWMKGATEGIIVAGGNGQGEDLTQLSYPHGVWVDGYGHVYVVDAGNSRVMRWEKGAKEGTVIVGGNGRGEAANQLDEPFGLFFDRHGHLYVAEFDNHRVRRFSLLVD